MQITRVIIRTVEKEHSKLKGFADVTFDDCFVVHGIAIIETDSGRFLGMPYREEANGNADGNARAAKIDIAHPVTREFREVLDAAVIGEYLKVADGPTTIGADE